MIAVGRLFRLSVLVVIAAVADLAFRGGTPHAVAEHQHGGGTSTSIGSTPERGRFGASLSLVAASFNTMAYVGDYQGAMPSLGWSNARFLVSATMPVYRLTKNGSETYGPGDAMAHGVATLVMRPATQLGVALMIGVPTGGSREGLGMGHVMVMPGLWASHTHRALTVAASIGSGHAVGGDGHAHGAWPLVDPMNKSELTWTASGDIVLARALTAGLRTSGAAPLTDDGVTRIVAAARVLWTARRVATAFEIQTGLAGDPFTVRGVLETSIQF